MVGFNVMQKLHLLPWMLIRLLLDVWRGRLTLSECVMDGIESFPSALETLFNGGHVGKLLVKVADGMRPDIATGAAPAAGLSLPRLRVGFSRVGWPAPLLLPLRRVRILAFGCILAV